MDASGVALVIIGPGSVDQVCPEKAYSVVSTCLCKLCVSAYLMN